MMKFLKIDNSKNSAVNGKWSDPGAKLYDNLLDANDSRWNVNGRNVFPEDEEAKTWNYWPDFIKEAYLIAPVKDIKNSPYGRTPYSRSGCKYPHHVIKGDKLVLSIAGVKAAYKRAKQMGVYHGDIKKHLENHMIELGLLINEEKISESMIEDNFDDIYNYIHERTGIDLFDDIDENFMEASHGKLKYDFRMGWDYETGHQIKVVYSLDNINITDIGDFYYNYDGKKVGATHDSHLDYTRKNIAKKGNTDHQSKGQKVLAIVDLVTNKKLNNVKLLNPFCPGIDTHETTQSNIKEIQLAADKNPNSYINNLTVGEIDNNPTYKSTHWASRVIDSKTGENLRFNKIAKSETLKDGRGWKVNNIDAKDFPIYNDDGKYMIYHNPNKKQALNELYMREKDIINYATDLKNAYKNNTLSDDWTKEEVIQTLKREQNNLRIIRDDIETIENGQYDLAMMKKYREASMIEVAESDINEYVPNAIHALEGADQTVLSSKIVEECGRRPEDIYEWMRKNISYDNASPSEWKLKSPQETYDLKKGNCHDQSLLSFTLFKSMGYKRGQIFFIEYKEGESVGGNTHTFTWYIDEDKYYWFETAWENKAGIHGPYNSIAELKEDVRKEWNNDINSRSYSGVYWDGIEFSETSKYKVGMGLGDYVDSWLFEEFTEKSHRALKYCYRIGFDVDTGEEVAIKFLLEPDKITQFGDPQLTANICNRMDKSVGFTSDSPEIKRFHDNAKNKMLSNTERGIPRIQHKGHIDFCTDELKVDSIFHQDGKSLKSVKMIPLFSNAVIELIRGKVSHDPILIKIYNESNKSLYAVFKSPEFKKIFIDEFKYRDNIYEIYNVGDFAAKGKYKTTKLLWDIDLFKSLKLTPSTRGYLNNKKLYNDRLPYNDSNNMKLISNYNITNIPLNENKEDDIKLIESFYIPEPDMKWFHEDYLNYDFDQDYINFEKHWFEEGNDNMDEIFDLLLEDAENSDNEDKKFVPIYGIIKEYSLSKFRNDGTIKDDGELSSVRFHKIIKALTRGDNYSHALVSFDDSLTNMYSYEDEGFVVDNIMTKDSWMGTSSIYICVMFVSKEDKSKMEKYVKDLKDHADESAYASANLLKAYVGKPYKVDKRFVCSSFTGYILSCSNPKNLHRDYSRLRPEDITILPRAFYVMNVKDREDFINHKNDIKKKVDAIYNEYKDDINDYNNHLPKLMLQDRVDKLKTIDKIFDWIIDRL